MSDSEKIEPFLPFSIGQCVLDAIDKERSLLDFDEIFVTIGGVDPLDEGLIVHHLDLVSGDIGYLRHRDYRRNRVMLLEKSTVPRRSGKKQNPFETIANKVSPSLIRVYLSVLSPGTFNEVRGPLIYDGGAARPIRIGQIIALMMDKAFSVSRTTDSDDIDNYDHDPVTNTLKLRRSSPNTEDQSESSLAIDSDTIDAFFHPKTVRK